MTRVGRALRGAGPKVSRTMGEVYDERVEVLRRSASLCSVWKLLVKASRWSYSQQRQTDTLVDEQPAASPGPNDQDVAAGLKHLEGCRRPVSGSLKSACAWRYRQEKTHS